MADTNPYELIFITQPEIANEDVDALVGKLKDIIQKNEGSLTNEDRWGRRRLAYPINGQREGFYDVLTFSTAAPAIAQIEHQLKVTDSVIRHLITRVEKPKRRKPRREKPAKPAAAATAAPTRPTTTTTTTKPETSSAS